MHRKEIILTHQGKEITAFSTADAGANTNVESVAHGLATGDLICIGGTTNYDATGLVVTYVDADNFKITTDFVADDGVGMWTKAHAGSGTLNSGWIDAEPFDHAILYSVVSVYTGGTLTPTLYASPDGGTTAISTGVAGAGISSATTEFKDDTGPIGKLVRVGITLAGTEEMTFKVYLELARTGGL